MFPDLGEFRLSIQTDLANLHVGAHIVKIFFGSSGYFHRNDVHRYVHSRAKRRKIKDKGNKVTAPVQPPHLYRTCPRIGKSTAGARLAQYYITFG